jgi:hypothetical protein
MAETRVDGMAAQWAEQTVPAMVGWLAAAMAGKTAGSTADVTVEQ